MMFTRETSRHRARASPGNTQSRTGRGRRPMPGVRVGTRQPLSSSTSNASSLRRITTSRTDHGQDTRWKIERKAVSMRSGMRHHDPKSVYDNKVTTRRSTLDRDGIYPVSKQSTYGLTRSMERHTPLQNTNVFSPTPKSRSLRVASGSPSSYKLAAKMKGKITVSTTGVYETVKELGGGWVQRTSPKQRGTFTKAGLHTIVECRGGKFFICTLEPFGMETDTEHEELSVALRSGNFDFEISVKPASLPSDRAHERCHILLGYKSSEEFLCVTQEATDRVWRLDSFRGDTGGNATLLASVEDKMMRSSRFSTLLVQARGNRLHLSVGGRELKRGGFAIENPRDLCGAIGVACMRSKMIFKGEHLTKAGGIVAGRHQGIGAGVSSRPSTAHRDKLVRDGSLMIPERMVSGASDAGLGSMDGGVYSHMKSLKGAHVTRKPNHGDRSSVSTIVRDRPLLMPVQPGDTTSGDDEDHSLRGPNRDRKRAPFVDDDRYLIENIERDIINRDLGVAFEDIAGLEDAKRLLNEAVSLPLLVPEFFVGIREPWKGVLLYGPPGTGKTMLAKAAAGVDDITFFNASAATMINKYRGESEKLVRCLFRMARHYSPAIIFIDEIDALARTRGAGQEHEADRRLKSLLFSEMDGIHSGTTPHVDDEKRPKTVASRETFARVVVLATTNVPWDLDEAMRRRLEKRIYVPLPNAVGRKELLRLCLIDVETSLTNHGQESELDFIVRQSEGFSCADVKLLCREAAMMPMRRLLGGATPAEIIALRSEGRLEKPPPVEIEDFKDALKRTKSSVHDATLLDKYAKWQAQFGST